VLETLICLIQVGKAATCLRAVWSTVRTAPDSGDNLKAVKSALTTPHLRRIAQKHEYDSLDSIIVILLINRVF
jgi:hypothetical protein